MKLIYLMKKYQRLMLPPLPNPKKAATGWKLSRYFMDTTRSSALVVEKAFYWWWQPLNRATASDSATDLNRLEILASVRGRSKTTTPISHAPNYRGWNHVAQIAGK